MPNRLLPLLLLLSLACKKDAPVAANTGPAEVASAGLTAAAPDAAPDAAAKKPAAAKRAGRPAPTPELLRAAVKRRNGHITKGRKLAKAKRFEEAIAAFEEAVKLDPYDARALSELGWVAFQAGKLERADEATRTSLRFTDDPKVRGATLYNLGRIYEARAQLPEATAAYTQSLALRDNATVEKRLAALTNEGVDAEPWDDDCGFEGHETAKLKSLCAAMSTSEAQSICEDDAIQLWKLAHPRITEAASFAIYNEGEMTTYHQLAIKVDGVWHTDVIAHTYNPGAFGIAEEFEITTLELRPLLPGGQLALYIETRHDHYDSNMGSNEDSTRSHSATYVVGLRDDDIDWLFGSISEYSWTLEVLLEEEEEKMKEEGIIRDRPLPATESFAATISFKADEGAVSISTYDDLKLPHNVKVGDFKLLGEAPRCVALW